MTKTLTPIEAKAWFDAHNGKYSVRTRETAHLYSDDYVYVPEGCTAFVNTEGEILRIEHTYRDSGCDCCAGVYEEEITVTTHLTNPL